MFILLYVHLNNDLIASEDNIFHTLILCKKKKYDFNLLYIVSSSSTCIAVSTELVIKCFGFYIYINLYVL